MQSVEAGLNQCLSDDRLTNLATQQRTEAKIKPLAGRALILIMMEY